MNPKRNALTWDDLARLYGRGAKIRPMQDIYNWAVTQTDRIEVGEEGELYLKEVQDGPTGE